MKIFEKKKDLDQALAKIREEGQKIGLIPTMGSIHKGHLSLVKKSKKMNFYSIVSIFVNPTQFEDKKDFKDYPDNKDIDIKELKKINCDAIYFPSINEIYPKEIKSKKTIYDFRNILCDRFRAGHFDGVTTVVDSLFNIIKPDYAFFGEKDFQQLKIIVKLVEILNYKITIVSCPSVRYENGMSYSSRYKNFNKEQKIIFNEIAVIINHYIKNLKVKIDFNTLEKLKKDLLKSKIKKIDYIEIREEKNLEKINKNNQARLFLAFYLDKIRVVDNFLLY